MLYMAYTFNKSSAELRCISCLTYNTIDRNSAAYNNGNYSENMKINILKEMAPAFICTVSMRLSGILPMPHFAVPLRSI